MKKTITMFTAASAMLLAGLSAQAGTGVALKGPAHAIKPNSVGAAGLTITETAVGTSGFLPCFGCAGGEDIDLPYPINGVTAGETMISTVVLQDNFFVGSPTVVYSLVQGGSTLQTETVTFPFTLSPGELGLAYFPEPVPTTLGPAQVIMQVYNGSTLIATSNYHILIIGVTE